MKKIIEWLRVRTMPIMLVVCGIVYISFFDEQDIYGISDIKNFIDGAVEKYGFNSRELSDNMGNGGIPQNGVAKEDIQSLKDSENREDSQDGKYDENIDEDTDESIAGLGSDGSLTWRNPEDVVYGTVTDDYFSDAVFIGDSRTVGMYEYGGLEDISTFYASTGLTVYKMFDAGIVDVPGQKEKATIEQMLSEKSFSKIYLMIGINEMGTGTVDTFIAKYEECLEHLRELQPDAVIYIQAIMKVTTERSDQGDYITNEGIEERNERLKALADNVNIYYLDVNPLICDETGGMISTYTSDGVHLKAKYIDIWKQFLMENAVVQP